jgi:nitrile hydratase
MGAEHHDADVSRRVRELEARLIESGVLTGPEIDASLDDYLATKGVVTNGARLVARAWVDEDFKQRLLADGNAACRELGIEWSGEEPVFRAVENTPDRHNVIVCTLCSCYPTGLLGPSPHWYRSLEYRSRVVREPRAVLSEFGLDLPEETGVDVWDASADARYMVVPERPPGTEGLSERDLAALVTVRGLIGTASV